jgi:hypothetical protein
MTPILGIMASSISGSKAITGAYESIASATATGSVSSLTLSSIPSTYTSLQIRFNIKTTVNSQTLFYRMNGATTGYSWHMLEGDGSSASANGLASATQMDIFYFGGTSSTHPSVGIIDIHDYASTSKYKTARVIAGTDTNATVSQSICLTSGLYQSTSAVTSFTLAPQSGGFFSTGSTVALYGIKG